MSDLSDSRRSIGQGLVQPSVGAYFNADVLALEQVKIFAKLPRYVGHQLSVPTVGDYHTLPQESEGRVLMRHGPGDHGVGLMSNICRHRQAVMLRGRGHTRSNVVCPLHRWTYDLQGHLVGAPHFAEDPCLNLNRYPLRAWNGLLFEDRGLDITSELAGLDAKHELNLDGYVLDRVHVHECHYNWKTFIEVYLEDYHVGPFHPGLGNFVATDDLRWQMGKHFSVQTVGVARSGGEALGKAGSPIYRRWQDAIMAHAQGKAPSHGAIWLTLYPTVMVEWYPNTLVVSSLVPQGPQKTLNVVEFFYPEEIVAFEREYVEAQQAAYLETCVEDDEIALRMDAGRRALHLRGDNEAGPYQSPMEDGMQHFHEWYASMMA
jgi:choline monooxygenase